jgi:hypothetical protein
VQEDDGDGVLQSEHCKSLLPLKGSKKTLRLEEEDIPFNMQSSKSGVRV